MDQLQLRPFEIMRHPACQRLSMELHKRNHVVVWGPSGTGVSMFVNAHADLYWTRSGTRSWDVLKIILDDDNTSSTELFQTYPGILENSYKGIIVDLPGCWSRNVLRFFLNKISDRVKVVVVCSAPIRDVVCVQVDTSDSNENFQFLHANRHFFPYLPSNSSEFVKFAHEILSQLMSRFRYGCSGMDERSKDRFAVNTIEDARALLEHSTFDVSAIGDLEWQSRAMDVRSFADRYVINTLISSQGDQVEVRETLLAAVWLAGVKRFY